MARGREPLRGVDGNYPDVPGEPVAGVNLFPRRRFGLLRDAVFAP